MTGTRQPILIIAVLLIGAVLAIRILRMEPMGAAEEHEEHEDAEAAEGSTPSGPEGGRLLRDGDFALEVKLSAVSGTPPRFRVHLYQHDKPLAPTKATVRIEIRRLGGRPESFELTPLGDSLVASESIEEPHSFDVTVTAEHDGRVFRWDYPSYESRVQIDEDAARDSGVVVEAVGPVTLHTSVRVNGRILPNEDRLAHVIPRYPGIVLEARKRLGDPVAKGETLAIVQSNESLQPYAVAALIGGTVIRRHVTPGEFAGEGEDIYTVADLSSVWADFDVYREDFSKLRIGQRVRVDLGEGARPTEGTISYLSPFGAENTQTMLARVVLPNPTGELRPGLFVGGEVMVAEETVPLAVRASAMQKLEDADVVFVNEGDLYEARPFAPGRRDAEWIEVLSGLDPGQRYVAANSFLLKAEVGKSGVGHDH